MQEKITAKCEAADYKQPLKVMEKSQSLMLEEKNLSELMPQKEEKSMTISLLNSSPDINDISNDEDDDEVDLGLKAGRKPGIITNCKHVTLKHFAKGMCNRCYHRFGREAMADNCPHTDRKKYAKGKCQNCYINDYNKAKRKKSSGSKGGSTE